MFGSLSLPLLLAIFLAAAAAVWFAGVRLSHATDVLEKRLGLGEALGGLILLAIATNLPEIAIVASAALAHNVEVAVGNILGGIAIQTVVLALLDAIGAGPRWPLTFRAADLVLVLEGVLVIAMLTVAIMAAQLPAGLVVLRVGPGSIVLALLWGFGLWLLARARRGLPWEEEDPPADDDDADEGESGMEGAGTGRAALVFAVAAAVTLAGGVLLERSGDAIAGDIGMSGVLFAATVLAAATALPEVSTGLAAVKLGDYELVFSDIFGGNAFLPVLFLEASAISGTAVLPRAQHADIYLAGLGALLTAAYLAGLVFRPRRQVWRLGLDSWAVVLLYLAGLAGLVAIARA